MNKKLLLISAALFCLLLSGCVNPPKANEGSKGTQTSGDTAEGEGETVVVETQTTQSSGGLSNPDKCRGLPPAEMADCLEEAMGN